MSTDIKKEGQVSQLATSENGTKKKTNTESMNQGSPQVNPEQEVIVRTAPPSWHGRIWFEPESGNYWRAGRDGSWIALNERSIERHLRVNYGLPLEKVGAVASEVEKALDQIQMSYVLGGVEYIERYQRREGYDELKKFVNRVSLINGRNVLLLSSGVGK
jgi:hypothetical protein